MLLLLLLLLLLTGCEKGFVAIRNGIVVVEDTEAVANVWGWEKPTTELLLVLAGSWKDGGEIVKAGGGAAKLGLVVTPRGESTSSMLLPLWLMRNTFAARRTLVQVDGRIGQGCFQGFFLHPFYQRSKHVKGGSNVIMKG